MTFLEEIKEELTALRIKSPCCMRSELRGILMFGGVPYGGDVFFGTESFEAAKRVSTFLKRTCNVAGQEKLSERAEGYKFIIPEEVFGSLGLKTGAFVEESEDFEEKDCCKRAFVRGAFIAAGSAANPQKTYRMEIFSENKAAAEKAKEMIEAFSVEAKCIRRKQLWVVYANSSTAVGDFLKTIQASGAVFKILDTVVQKSTRNICNRQTNCDVANADRAVENAERETKAIRTIEKIAGLDFLKPKLKEAALLRLEYPSASLAEMCNTFEPPLAKSTLKNRLNKIIETAKELSGE